jgi:hypothetical protein
LKNINKNSLCGDGIVQEEEVDINNIIEFKKIIQDTQNKVLN